jgi:hypothetical protein
LALGSVLLLLADLLTEVINDEFHPGYLLWTPVKRILDLNAESSLGTWFSVAALLCCSALCALIAAVKRARSDRFARHWWTLAALAFALSIDEQAQLHDPGIGSQVRERIALHGVLCFGWVVPAFVTLVIIVIAFRHFVGDLPDKVRHGFVLAAVLYVMGEMGVEMADGWWADRYGRANLTYDVMTSAEEFLGMIGLIVAISTLLTYVTRHLGDVRFSTSPYEPATTEMPASQSQSAPASRSVAPDGATRLR